MTLEVATRNIVVEQTLPHSVDIVWKTLVTAELVEKWLMPNDFKPVVGHRFNFRIPPRDGWDGVVHCEVLEVQPGRRLVYSWKGGVRGKGGGDLDTVVTWTLRQTEAGTHLRMVQTSFRTPDNDLAYDAMSSGWQRIVGQSFGREAATIS